MICVIPALYGSIFSKTSEAAFSNYRMWESLGFIIAFAYSGFICTNIKIYVLTSVLILGMIGYYIVEWLHRLDNRKDDNNRKDDKAGKSKYPETYAVGNAAFEKEVTHL